MDSRPRHRRTGRQHWTRARIRSAVVAWVEEHGRPPRKLHRSSAEARSSGARDADEIAERFRAGDWPDARVVRRVYGSWGAALARSDESASSDAVDRAREIAARLIIGLHEQMSVRTRRNVRQLLLRARIVH